MRFMDRQQSEILHKLIYIAHGDTALVEKAIRACSPQEGAAPLGEVIRYIEANRASGPQRNAA